MKSNMISITGSRHKLIESYTENQGELYYKILVHVLCLKENSAYTASFKKIMPILFIHRKIVVLVVVDVCTQILRACCYFR